MKFIKDILTENDNITYCFSRVASFTGVLSYISAASFMLYHGSSFSLSEYATGFATLLAGAGAVIALKQINSK